MYNRSIGPIMKLGEVVYKCVSLYCIKKTYLFSSFKLLVVHEIATNYFLDHLKTDKSKTYLTTSLTSSAKISYTILIYNCNLNCYPRANGAKRRSGRKPGARVTNFVLAELKVDARDR